jgi:hypothetical protein
MSDFAAEPVPASIEAVTASYLDRQFNAIQNAFSGQFVAPKAAVLPNPRLPDRLIPGAIIYIENEVDPTQNGFYGCVKNSQGEGEWKKLQLS